MRKDNDWLVYFNVPSNEEKLAISLGAKHHKLLNKWYFNGNPFEIDKFAKWILEDKNEVFIVNSIYILEGKRTCYRCGQETAIIGLGISDFIHLYYDENTNQLNSNSEISNSTPIIHLAWVDKEDDIPPTLLRYIKMHYPVRKGFSSISGETFANHCEYCGSLQGNNYIFDEIDSPLSTSIVWENELVSRLSKINILSIRCNASLCLNWNISLCSSDVAYAKYCTIKKAYIWDFGLDCLYEEMYKLPINETSTDVSTEKNTPLQDSDILEQIENTTSNQSLKNKPCDTYSNSKFTILERFKKLFYK